MSKRMVDTKLWNDESIIENFTAEDKYFWLYILTSPHNNICGVFKNSPALIARDMGLHKDTIANLLYRFDRVHNLIVADKDTNEVLILNWYKYNWTKSPKVISLIEKEVSDIKSEKIRGLVEERILSLFSDGDTVSIPYRYPTNTNTNSNNNIIDSILLYFNKTYDIYPRKVSKIQARTTYEHKLVGLTEEECKKTATAIYRMLEHQITLWTKENEGLGRKTEHIPHFSTWLNDNIDDSPHFKGRKR